MDDLAAWIVADQVNLEQEVRSRCMFPLWAKKEFEKWNAERAELEVHLEQVDGYAYSLRAT